MCAGSGRQGVKRIQRRIRIKEPGRSGAESVLECEQKW